MTKNYLKVNSSELELHRRLVNLIIEESDRWRSTTDAKEKKRHEVLLGFLTELQCISAKGLKR